MSGGKKSGSYLAVDLSAIDERSDRTLRMMAHLDSGAELDGVGHNWASYLEIQTGYISYILYIEVVCYLSVCNCQYCHILTLVRYIILCSLAYSMYFCSIFITDSYELDIKVVMIAT